LKIRRRGGPGLSDWATNLKRTSLKISALIVVGFGLVFVPAWLALASVRLSHDSGETTGVYEIDNVHSSVIFAVNHFGLSYTYGRFNSVSGSFSMVNGQPDQTGFSFKIETASIDTNNQERDEHLQGAEFFDCQQFPEITFKTTGFRQVDGEYLVTGDLRIRDQIRNVTMPIRMVGIGKDPFGKEKVGFFTKFTIKRSEFGMDKMLGSIGDNVSVTFSFEAAKKP
jgi:polyisoprenoid-binding protein YceI